MIYKTAYFTGLDQQKKTHLMMSWKIYNFPLLTPKITTLSNLDCMHKIVVFLYTIIGSYGDIK